MKKIVVIAAIAFLVSMAAGAMGRKALAPPPTEEEIAAAAGHGVEDGTSPKSEGGHGEAGATAGHGAADSLSAGHGTDPGSDHAAPGPETHAADARPGSFEFREMGHILSSMEPREAGMFLSYLDDERAMGLLRAMSVGNAAAALAHVPDDRKEQLKACFLDLLLEEKKK